MNAMGWTVPSHGERSDDVNMASERSIEVRAGWLLISVFFGGLLVWASVARLDSAAYAAGSVAVAGHRQSVQHRDGGTVSRIAVHEGDRVKAGQVLLSLAPIEVEAAERALFAQVIGLEAERARLRAEQDGAVTVGPPAEFAALTGDDAVEARQALDRQRQEMLARRGALLARKRVLGQQSAALSKAIGGFEHEIVTTSRQRNLLQAELTGLSVLAARGFASMNRVREMQRVDAGLDGQTASLAANAAQSRAQIGQNSLQALSLDHDRLEEVARSLRETGDQLADLIPKLEAAREQLRRLVLRAPVAGKVAGLTVFSVGGVVAPGQRVLDIVPINQPVVIDARLRPDDTDGVHVGQSVEIKVAAIHDRRMPSIYGRITRLSPDVLTDERSGAQYFSVEAAVPDSEIRRVVALRGVEGGLRTGQPAQLIVPLKPRTALQYLLEPIAGPFWTAFRER